MTGNKPNYYRLLHELPNEEVIEDAFINLRHILRMIKSEDLKVKPRNKWILESAYYFIRDYLKRNHNHEPGQALTNAEARRKAAIIHWWKHTAVMITGSLSPLEILYLNMTYDARTLGDMLAQPVQRVFRTNTGNSVDPGWNPENPEKPGVFEFYSPSVFVAQNVEQLKAQAESRRVIEEAKSESLRRRILYVREKKAQKSAPIITDKDHRHYDGNPCRVCGCITRYVNGDKCVACARKCVIDVRAGRTRPRVKATYIEGSACGVCGSKIRYKANHQCVSCKAEYNRNRKRDRVNAHAARRHQSAQNAPGEAQG
ncbi:hypothetical protein HZV87_004430 [Salmonella enterica]|nr:hypothetical protein [Salmonella enterica]